MSGDTFSIEINILFPLTLQRALIFAKQSVILITPFTDNVESQYQMVVNFPRFQNENKKKKKQQRQTPLKKKQQRRGRKI